MALTKVQSEMGQSNAPTFSAWLAADQSVTSGVDTKLQFATEEWDTNSNFNNTGSTVGSNPSYSFLPTIAGYYQVVASVYPNTAVSFAQAAIYKNGSLYKRGFSSSTNGIGQISCLVYLNGTTDYISCYGNVSGISPVVSLSTNLTWFSASMVRPA